MDRPTSDANDIPERLPEAVWSRLEALDRRDVRADPEVDAAVLAEARAYFGTRFTGTADAAAAQAGGAQAGGAQAGGAQAGAAQAGGAQAGAAEAAAAEAGASQGDAAPARMAPAVRRSRDATPAAGVRSRRPRRKPARWAAGAVAAAVVLAAFIVVRPLDRFGPYDPDDIDRSGRVDILDAFALARMRADGAPIGEAEIDTIAARAVALEPAGTGR